MLLNIRIFRLVITTSETLACTVQVTKTLKAAMQTSVTDLELEWRFSGSEKLVQVPSEMPPVFSGDRLIIYAINAGQQVITIAFASTSSVFQYICRGIYQHQGLAAIVAINAKCKYRVITFLLIC